MNYRYIIDRLKTIAENLKIDGDPEFVIEDAVEEIDELVDEIEDSL